MSEGGTIGLNKSTGVSGDLESFFSGMDSRSVS